MIFLVLRFNNNYNINLNNKNISTRVSARYQVLYVCNLIILTLSLWLRCSYSLLDMRKLKLREMKELPQSHLAINVTNKI